MTRIIIIAALIVLMCGCHTHKQTQTETHVTEDVETSSVASTEVVRTHKRATAVKEALTIAADSVVMAIEADSVITADGTRIYNARARATKHRPTASVERDDVKTASDSASLTVLDSKAAARHDTFASEQHNTTSPAKLFTTADVCFLWGLIIVGLIIIGIAIYKTIKLQ